MVARATPTPTLKELPYGEFQEQAEDISERYKEAAETFEGQKINEQISPCYLEDTISERGIQEN